MSSTFSDDDRLVVVDLEATCDDRGAVPKPEMEIIEIGAVLVHGQDYRFLADFQLKPRRARRRSPWARVHTPSLSKTLETWFRQGVQCRCYEGPSRSRWASARRVEGLPAQRRLEALHLAAHVLELLGRHAMDVAGASQALGTQ